jgi:hypothetical protein
MTTPIPTPFDIIDPGPGALVPSGLAWLALVAVSLLICAAIAIKRRIPKAKSINARLQKLLDELRAGATGVTAPQDIERLARLVRRIVSPYMSVEVSGMSSGDLRLAAATLHTKPEERDRSLSEALLLLATIEELAYAPRDSISDARVLSGILEKLVTSLESHVRRFPPL